MSAAGAGHALHLAHVVRVVHLGQLVRRGMTPFHVLDLAEQLHVIAQRTRDRAEPSDVFGVTPSGIVPAAVGMRDERNGHAAPLRRRGGAPARGRGWRYHSPNGAPAPIRQQKDRAVLRARLREHLMLVEYFEAAQLEDVVPLIGARHERAERGDLHREHALGGLCLDANRVPDLGDLDAQRERRSARCANVNGLLARAQRERRSARCANVNGLLARAQRRHERERHSTMSSTMGAGSSVVKKREICASYRYVDARTRVPASTGVTPTTISSPPCPRKVTYDGPSFSGKAP